MNKKAIIGITGGIASGKSYVCDYLEKKGFKILDTDKLYDDLIVQGKPCYNALINYFPYKAGNKLDKRMIASIVFKDKDKLNLLNSIVHPIIYNECKKIIEETKENLFLVVPLMFEAHFDDLCDLVVCVYTQKNEQINRLMSRNSLSKDDAILRIKSQMSVEEKKKKSDILLESCNDFNETNSNIEKMLERIKEYGKNF